MIRLLHKLYNCEPYLIYINRDFAGDSHSFVYLPIMFFDRHEAEYALLTIMRDSGVTEKLSGEYWIPGHRHHVAHVSSLWFNRSIPITRNHVNAFPEPVNRNIFTYLGSLLKDE